MANDNKAYKEALKQLDNMLKKQEALKKSTESLSNSWNSIATEIFKMDGAAFFKNVEKSPEQLKAMGEEIISLEETFKNLGDEFSNALAKDDKIKMIQKSLRGVGDQFKLSSSKLNSSMKSSFNTIISSLDEDLKKVVKNERDLEQIMTGQKKISDDRMKKLKELTEFQELEKEHKKLVEEFDNKKIEIIEKLKKDMPELANLDKEILNTLSDQLIEGKEIEEVLKNSNEQQREALALLSEQPKELKEINKGMSKTVDQISAIKKDAKEMNKEFSLSKGLMSGLGSMVSGLGSIIKRDWIGAVMKFDEVLNDVQKQTGINMDDNAEAFANLQTNVAQFGMSIEQAGKMMTDMSNELRSTDFSVLSKAAEDFAAIEGATGAASSDITTIGGEMMRLGQSSEQVKDYMEETSMYAQKFGVSSKRAIEGISRNIKKMREMGFVGGEKSLQRMVVTAERLKMNIDETFDMAKRARSIEGAMEMAAELQLAGGSFSNINPMDLLAAARKGPEELQKILTQMGGDIGHFNEETGEMEFDPVDVDRLQIISDATGQSMESLQNMISTNSQDMMKLEPFQGMLDGMDEAEQALAKSALSDMMKFDAKTRKMVIDADNDLAKKMGIDSLDDINEDNIKGMLKQKEEDAKTLEEQNKRNQSLKQAFDNFVNALMSIFSFFQPALEVLTKVMQTVTSVLTTVMGWLPGWSKWLIGGLILAFAIFGTSVGAFITQGIGGFLKGALSFAKSTGDLIKQVLAGNGGGVMKSIAGKFGFGGGGDKKGPVEDAMGKGSDIAGDKTMTPAAGQAKKGFLVGLAEGIKEFGKVEWKDLLKFAAALAIIGLAVIGFGIALATIGGEAGIGQMVTAGVSLGMLMLAVWGMSLIAKGIDMGNVLKGALALFIIGAALIPFAFAAQMLTDVDLMSVLGAMGVLGLIVLSLIGLGLLLSLPIVGWLLMAGIAGLIAIGAGLLLAGTGMLAAATAFEKLGAIDWSGFGEMAVALGGLIMPLIGFSFAAMAFANPLALFGILMMTFALSGLAAVLAPISEALTVGADSLDRFAEGLVKLGAAADALSLEKLEKLKELSDAMATASTGAAAMAAMANFANMNGGGGTGGGGGANNEPRRLEIAIKMNGRDVQAQIVKDSAIHK